MLLADENEGYQALSASLMASRVTQTTTPGAVTIGAWVYRMRSHTGVHPLRHEALHVLDDHLLTDLRKLLARHVRISATGECRDFLVA